MSAIERATLPHPSFRIRPISTVKTRVAPSCFQVPAEIAAVRLTEIRLPGISEEMHFNFSQGGNVAEYLGRYMYIRLASGAMTVDGVRCDKATYELYASWRQKLGMRDLPREEVLAAVSSIYQRLNLIGIKGENKEGFGSPDKKGMVQEGEAWKLIDQTLALLPNKFLGNGEIKKIVFGSARIGAALASAYEDGAVFIYCGALHGSRRELVAKILHECGHSTLNTLRPAQIEELKMAHQQVLDSLIGLDIMGGESYRRSYQHSFSEFIAEMHLIYVCDGPRLRKTIEKSPANSEQKKAWELIYAFLRDQVFDGRAYE